MTKLLLQSMPMARTPTVPTPPSSPERKHRQRSGADDSDTDNDMDAQRRADPLSHSIDGRSLRQQQRACGRLRTQISHLLEVR